MLVVNTVSVWSMAWMVVTLVFCLVITFGLFLILRKRWKLKVVPALVGAAAFVVFALVLESLLHVVVLRPAADGTIALMDRPLLYVLYGTLAAGIFEETGRFISFLILRRKYQGVSTALSYGIGHGGIEVLLLVGLTMVSNLVLSAMINAGMAGMLGNTPQVITAVSQLTDTPSWMFAIAGVERIPAMVVQISLSVVVWHSVNTAGKRWLYPLAILLHAVVNVTAALYQCGVITNILIVEAVTILLAALLAIGVVRLHKRLRSENTV